MQTTFPNQVIEAKPTALQNCNVVHFANPDTVRFILLQQHHGQAHQAGFAPRAVATVDRVHNYRHPGQGPGDGTDSRRRRWMLSPAARAGPG